MSGTIQAKFASQNAKTSDFVFIITEKSMSGWINIINQLFEIEQKILNKGETEQFNRNFDRLKFHFSEIGITYHNPVNEKYTDTRTDCTATIVGELHENDMYISKVIKPTIFQTDSGGAKSIIQKAVVIVESKKQPS